MELLLADRMHDTPETFIQQILAIAKNREIISFAGGLPNANFFPVKGVKKAALEVFERQRGSVLQYSNTEGEIELREWIATRYREKGLEVSAENIIITNGSQQGLDLMAKVFVNPGDSVLIEKPGYLGAIQSLALYQPVFRGIPLKDSGMDIEVLQEACSTIKAKMLYMVPTFQNPSGITYSAQNRRNISEIAKENSIVLIEDDPYGELRFSGKQPPSFAHYLPEQTVLFGSFSKTIAPGFRLGWIAAPGWLRDTLLVAKQAADLHTSSFTQQIIARFLETNDLDAHLQKIIAVYGSQCQAMLAAVEEYLPKDITTTRPEGGMFLWGRLPEGKDAMALFKEAVKEQVAFVPGAAFYATPEKNNCFRLSFSCVDTATIQEGMQRLKRALDRFL
ncbi:MAG: aspartate aminotransferase [Deltaproteobacteria bacterium]|nr:MAG: aspartate aminotransferase [Deltaproteobacteria bacterium]